MADELEIFNFTTGLIKEAGRLVLNGSQSSENFNEKSNAVDVRLTWYIDINKIY